MGHHTQLWKQSFFFRAIQTCRRNRSQNMWKLFWPPLCCGRKTEIQMYPFWAHWNSAIHVSRWVNAVFVRQLQKCASPASEHKLSTGLLCSRPSQQTTLHSWPKHYSPVCVWYRWIENTFVGCPSCPMPSQNDTSGQSTEKGIRTTKKKSKKRNVRDASWVSL